MQSASSSSSNVVWPSGLQLLLIGHLQNIDNLEEPTYPPLGDGKRTCFYVLSDLLTRINSKYYHDSPVDQAYHEMAMTFCLQLLEDACQKSFLRPRERERLKAFFLRKHSHTGHTRKKREGEGGASDFGLAECGGDKPLVYAHQLPADYLLRFFAALPLLVDTYLNFCGGNEMDKSLLSGLWRSVDLVLKELDAASATVFYSPMLEYLA